eukprot:3074387-Rhodomonas_salina.1
MSRQREKATLRAKGQAATVHENIQVPNSSTGLRTPCSYSAAPGRYWATHTPCSQYHTDRCYAHCV